MYKSSFDSFATSWDIKQYICERRFCGVLKDPFGDVIKKIMDEIHTHAELKPLCEPGTQNYEQWVVQKEQNGKKTHILLLFKTQPQDLRYVEVYLRFWHEHLNVIFYLIQKSERYYQSTSKLP